MKYYVIDATGKQQERSKKFVDFLRAVLTDDGLSYSIEPSEDRISIGWRYLYRNEEIAKEYNKTKHKNARSAYIVVRLSENIAEVIENSNKLEM